MNLSNLLWTYMPVLITSWLVTMICYKLSSGVLANHFNMENRKIVIQTDICFFILYICASVLYLVIDKSFINALTIVPLSSIFVAHFVIDIKDKELPDKLNLAIAILGIVRLAIVLINGGFKDIYLHYALSCLITSVVMFVIYLVLACVTGGALGGGDIKLVTALGLFLPTASLVKFLLTPIIIGAFISMYLLIFKKAKKEDTFPFGPSILISFVILLFI